MLNDVLWADACLKAVTIDYDGVTLRLRESAGRDLSIRCEGHIAVHLGGFWDETIIERAELLSSHDVIDRTIRVIASRLGANWGDSGSPTRNERSWKALRVHMLDGCTLEVVAVDFRAIGAQA